MPPSRQKFTLTRPLTLTSSISRNTNDDMLFDWKRSWIQGEGEPSKRDSVVGQNSREQFSKWMGSQDNEEHRELSRCGTEAILARQYVI